MLQIHTDPILTIWISYNPYICTKHSLSCGFSSAMPPKFPENPQFSAEMAGIVGIVGTIPAFQHPIIPTSSQNDEYGCLIPALSREACHA